MNISKYNEVVVNCRKIVIKKDEKYGDNWQKVRLSSIIDYILMKYSRLNNLVNNTEKNYDKIESDLQDTLNYCVFALIKLKEEKK